MQSLQKNNIPNKDYLSSNFTVTTQTIDFSKINKAKIGEYIELMHEHQLNCVKNGNFIDINMKIDEKTEMKDLILKYLLEQELWLMKLEQP